MVVKYVSGRDFPRSYAQLRAWFDEDWKCLDYLDYLDWLRWPEGFVCPHCAGVVGWGLADSRWKCDGCDPKVSATAGTIFDKTRTPLTVWFATAWRMVGDKVDEYYLGGPEPGIPGRGTLGKVLFAGAIERNPGRFGRASSRTPPRPVRAHRHRGFHLGDGCA